MESVDLELVNLKQVITHHIGNKHNGDEVKLSEMSSTVKPESLEYLQEYFFKKIPWAEFYSFGTEEEDLASNKVYQEVKNIFENPDAWIPSSKRLAEYLYECSDHPMIKSGAFNVVLFENINYDDESMRAIGLFKSTSKKAFMQMDQKERNFEIRHSLGYDVKSMDQACLILETDEDEGYRSFCFDSVGSGSDAQYWKKHFLNLKACESEFHKTSAYMNLAKNFVVEKIDEDFDVERVDKIDLLNRSANYFKKNEEFIKKDFEDEVFEDEEVIASFRDFNQQLGLQNKLVNEDRFEISEQAVKRESKGFKSVLKLDKNFHIYIHGNRNLIQKGSDEDGKKFYKVYFDVES
ncbi:MAG: hypothetical protein ACI8XB_002994 [Patiriisocius sp.]|jgi:hypothetical protein